MTACTRGRAAWTSSRPGQELISDSDSDIGPVADQSVYAPLEQAPHVRLIIHGPDLHLETSRVRVANEARRDKADGFGPFGDLIRLIGCAAYGESQHRSIHGQPHL